MSNLSLLKLYSFFAFTAFFSLSCTKIQERKIAVQFGVHSWTFEEVQDYFQFRLKGVPFFEEDLSQLKRKILNEIFFRAILENWSKTYHIQAEKVKLNDLEKSHFSRYNIRLSNLLDHKLYLNLQQSLQEELLKGISNPSLKEQKRFYKENRKLFFEPKRCYLKQILVKKEPLAKALFRRIQKGESFERISQSYSLSAHPGWIKKGDLEVFDKACLGQVKSLSPVLKSPYGYHILFVFEKRPGRQRSFSKVQKQVVALIKQGKMQKHFQIWLKKEIQKTALFVNKNFLDNIQIRYKRNGI